ncbi:unnamed protein product [Amoebophrya sp. A120]|nr:unnamed protein product [Amoebophrya sp. A120]|eukprot:GSA120T00021731001.1
MARDFWPELNTDSNAKLGEDFVGEEFRCCKATSCCGFSTTTTTTTTVQTMLTLLADELAGGTTAAPANTGWPRTFCDNWGSECNAKPWPCYHTGVGGKRTVQNLKYGVPDYGESELTAFLVCFGLLMLSFFAFLRKLANAVLQDLFGICCCCLFVDVDENGIPIRNVAAFLALQEQQDPVQEEVPENAIVDEDGTIMVEDPETGLLSVYEPRPNVEPPWKYAQRETKRTWWECLFRLNAWAARGKSGQARQEELDSALECRRAENKREREAEVAFEAAQQKRKHETKLEKMVRLLKRRHESEKLPVTGVLLRPIVEPLEETWTAKLRRQKLQQGRSRRFAEARTRDRDLYKHVQPFKFDPAFSRHARGSAMEQGAMALTSTFHGHFSQVRDGKLPTLLESSFTQIGPDGQPLVRTPPNRGKPESESSSGSVEEEGRDAGGAAVSRHSSKGRSRQSSKSRPSKEKAVASVDDITKKLTNLSGNAVAREKSRLKIPRLKQRSFSSSDDGGVTSGSSSPRSARSHSRSKETGCGGGPLQRGSVALARQKTEATDGAALPQQKPAQQQDQQRRCSGPAVRAPALIANSSRASASGSGALPVNKLLTSFAAKLANKTEPSPEGNGPASGQKTQIAAHQQPEETTNKLNMSLTANGLQNMRALSLMMKVRKKLQGGRSAATLQKARTAGVSQMQGAIMRNPFDSEPNLMAQLMTQKLTPGVDLLRKDFADKGKIDVEHQKDAFEWRAMQFEDNLPFDCTNMRYKPVVLKAGENNKQKHDNMELHQAPLQHIAGNLQAPSFDRRLKADAYLFRKSQQMATRLLRFLRGKNYDEGPSRVVDQDFAQGYRLFLQDPRARRLNNKIDPNASPELYAELERERREKADAKRRALEPATKEFSRLFRTAGEASSARASDRGAASDRQRTEKPRDGQHDDATSYTMAAEYQVPDRRDGFSAEVRAISNPELRRSAGKDLDRLVYDGYRAADLQMVPQRPLHSPTASRLLTLQARRTGNRNTMIGRFENVPHRDAHPGDRAGHQLRLRTKEQYWDFADEMWRRKVDEMHNPNRTDDVAHTDYRTFPWEAGYENNEVAQHDGGENGAVGAHKRSSRRRSASAAANRQKLRSETEEERFRRLQKVQVPNKRAAVVVRQDFGDALKPSRLDPKQKADVQRFLKRQVARNKKYAAAINSDSDD